MYTNHMPTTKNRAYQMNELNSWKSAMEDNLGTLQDNQEEVTYAIRSSHTDKTLPATITTQTTQHNTPTIANSTICTNVSKDKIRAVSLNNENSLTDGATVVGSTPHTTAQDARATNQRSPTMTVKCPLPLAYNPTEEAIAT